MSEPTQTVLTPAQVEIIEEMLEDRQTRLIAYVNDSIAAAMTVLRQEMTAQVDTLRQEVATELTSKVTYSERVALRATNDQALSAVQSDFAEDKQVVRWEWRHDIGQWESFTVERGQV
jgi:hypothetical protein